MIITVVCDVLGEENNGTTIAAMNLIRSLKAKGHTVRVVCPDKFRKDDEGFFIVPTYNLGIFNNYVAKNGVSLSKPDEDIIRKAISGADVVHIMLPFAVGICAADTAIEMNIPITAGFHCQAENISNHLFMMNFKAVNKLIYKIFRKKFYNKCNCIHYPTKFICDTFENITGSTNHYIISNGVNSQFVHKNVPKPENIKDKFVILFTGRYSKEKSHKILIDAVSKSKHRNDIQLIFAGDGPQRENIIKCVKKHGITMPIMKFFSRKELIDVINYSDLYVHPAEIEIEAISCLEAISCGKVPVISDSPRSATRYFALGENNLFKCNDSRNLAEKIDYWIEHPQEKQKCSEQYLGYADNFRFEKCMDRMEEMLIDAAQAKKEE